jgi:putative ABC transport system permease protein
VLGANISGIVGLISKPFFKLSMLSFVLGSALSAYLAHQWLQSFAYQTPLSWQLYVIPFSVLLFVLLVTVGWHAYRAANVNPVKSLRNE